MDRIMAKRQAAAAKAAKTKPASKKPAGSKAAQSKPSPEVVAQIEQVRGRIHSAFGQAAMAMMVLPRYRHLPLSELSHVLMEPLVRDRVALASSKPDNDNGVNAATGIAIWASVSEAVDAKIREQIKAGVFPVRLQSGEWTSGDINWLLDVIAPNQGLATSVIANFKQVVKQGDVRIHPLVTRLVDKEALEKMGAKPAANDDGAGGPKQG